MWSAVPFPALAWFQTPVPGTRPMGGAPAGILGLQSPAPLGNGLVPGGPGVGGGVTAPALVTALAMRRGQPAGPTTDPEIEDFIYDALDLLPGSSEVEVRCDGAGSLWRAPCPRSGSSATSARLPGPFRLSMTCRTTSRLLRGAARGARP